MGGGAHLGVHDALLLEASVEHVHGENLAPQVAVVLGVVAPRQVAEGGRHVGSCGGAVITYGVPQGQCWDPRLLFLHDNVKFLKV